MSTGQVLACQVPNGVRPGQIFEVRLPGDHKIQVRCPQHMKPGDSFRIQPFKVVVPPDGRPGQPFNAMVNNINTTIRCPKKAKAGHTITVYAPVFPAAPSGEACKTWDRSKWEAYLKHMQTTTPGVSEDLVSKADEINPDEISADYICSITSEIMSDPVLAIDGHTYERKAIEGWFEKHDTSPKTNETLPSKILIPNRALRSRIVDFLENYTPKPAPEAVSPEEPDIDFTAGAFSSQLQIVDEFANDSASDNESDQDNDMGVFELWSVFLTAQARSEISYETQTDEGLSSLRHTGFELKAATPYRFGFRFRVLGGNVPNMRCIMRTKRSDGRGSVEVTEKILGTLRASEIGGEWSCAEIAPRGQQALGRYESALQFVDGNENIHFQCVQSHTIRAEWSQ